MSGWVSCRCPSGITHVRTLKWRIRRCPPLQPVRLATSKHDPDDPYVLVGDGNRGLVESTPPLKLIDPCVEGVRLSRGCLNDGSGVMHAQGSRMLAAARPDAEQHDSLAARVMARNESDPGGEVVPSWHSAPMAAVAVFGPTPWMRANRWRSSDAPKVLVLYPQSDFDWPATASRGASAIAPRAAVLREVEQVFS